MSAFCFLGAITTHALFSHTRFVSAWGLDFGGCEFTHPPQTTQQVSLLAARLPSAAATAPGSTPAPRHCEPASKTLTQTSFALRVLPSHTWSPYAAREEDIGAPPNMAPNKFVAGAGADGAMPCSPTVPSVVRGTPFRALSSASANASMPPMHRSSAWASSFARRAFIPPPCSAPPAGSAATKRGSASRCKRV